jgi:nucleotide-binding universal stress UspA family protein
MRSPLVSQHKHAAMVVLAAVDADPGAERVARAARELAERIGTDLVVLHVKPGHAFEELGPSGSGPSSDEATDEAESVARDVVADTVDDPSTVTTSGRVGDPVEEILTAVEESDADYLVVGGRKRSPVGKAVFGSVTQSLLLDADVPVTLVNLDD